MRQRQHLLLCLLLPILFHETQANRWTSWIMGPSASSEETTTEKSVQFKTETSSSTSESSVGLDSSSSDKSKEFSNKFPNSKLKHQESRVIFPEEKNSKTQSSTIQSNELPSSSSSAPVVSISASTSTPPSPSKTTTTLNQTSSTPLSISVSIPDPKLKQRQFSSLKNQPEVKQQKQQQRSQLQKENEEQQQRKQQQPESLQFQNYLDRSKSVFDQFQMELRYNKFIVAFTTLKKVRENIPSAEESLRQLFSEPCRYLWTAHRSNHQEYLASAAQCPVTIDGVERELVELENLFLATKQYRISTDGLISPVNGSLAAARGKFEQISKYDTQASQSNSRTKLSEPESRQSESALNWPKRLDPKQLFPRDEPDQNLDESQSISEEFEEEEDEQEDKYDDFDDSNFGDVSMVYPKNSSSSSSSPSSSTTQKSLVFNTALTVRENFQEIENAVELNVEEKMSKFSELIDQVLSVKGWETQSNVFQLALLIKNSRVLLSSSSSAVGEAEILKLKSKFPALVQLLSWADKAKLNAQLNETSETLKIYVDSMENYKRSLQVDVDRPEMENDMDYWKFIPVFMGKYFALYNIRGDVILGVEAIKNQNQNQSEGNDDGYKVVLESMRGRDILMSPSEFFWVVSMVCNDEPVDNFQQSEAKSECSALRLSLVNRQYPDLTLSLNSHGNLTMTTANAGHPGQLFLSPAISTKYIMPALH